MFEYYSVRNTHIFSNMFISNVHVTKSTLLRFKYYIFSCVQFDATIKYFLFLLTLIQFITYLYYALDFYKSLSLRMTFGTIILITYNFFIHIEEVSKSTSLDRLLNDL